MAVSAKIVAYNKNSSTNPGCNDFSMNAYWGNDYKNVFYVCGDLGRPEFVNIIETEVDITGASTRTQNTSIERYNISILAISPLLQFLNTIDKHDVKEITFLDTGITYIIKNIDIDDQGETLTPTNLVYITFEDEAVSKASDVVFSLDAEKQAFWDNNNNGSKDIDGEAEYQPAFVDVFNTWQLYFESDGTTPATSGDVLMLVYAVNPASTSTNTIDSLIGVFRGEFSDLFSDSTKWQSTQQIWNYFNIVDKVGHTNRVQFDKHAFAQDNGYLSSETEDRAVNIRFDLSIDGSGQESTTLSLVYAIRGAFNACRIQDITNRSYGITTIGKVNTKNTLSTIQDIRVQGASVTGPITVTTLISVNTFSNKYLLAVSGTVETSFEGSFTTKAGYIGSTFRGAYGGSNFSFNLDELTAVFQEANILNFTVGVNPLILNLKFKYERDTSSGGFAVLGDITASGAAELLLDGALVTTIPAIAPATALVLGTEAVTLPDTSLHTMALTLPTTTGKTIFNEFEVQVKSIF